MAIRFLNTILSGSLKVSGSYTLPIIDTGSTGVIGQMGINGEVPYFYNSNGWQAVSGSKVYVAPPFKVEYLLVAGGGGAAKSGGGAGGYLSSSLSDITSGSTITVTVGAGGTGIQGSGQGTTANQGGNSSLASSEFSTLTAIGGGGGAIAYYGVGGDGGSGGGGAGLDATGDGDGGSGTAGQGFDGGDGKYTTSHGGLYAMGGGGGASEVGSDGQNSTVNGSAKNGGDGGDGKQSKITGTLTYYAGGGGGGVHGDTTGYVSGDGGQGGGADAADQPGSNGQNAGNAGTANTGGGGGGAASLVSYSGQTGGQGGSGVVILAYPTGSVTAKGGRITTRSDGQFVHTFTSAGTLTFGDNSFNTVAPGDNFNTVLYTGNATARSIAVGFQPDFAWIKDRTTNYSHALVDSVRGANSEINSNDTTADYTETNGLTAFTSTGFTLGNLEYSYNKNNDNYVAWCWRAGGAAVSNTDGTITSQVSANQAAGFSIIRNTGTSNYSDTVGHGLSQAPEMIIQKGLSGTTDWYVLFNIDGTGGWDWCKLNSTDAFAADNPVRFSANSTTINNWGWTNYDMINYCWHSVAGYSKIGTYTGNGLATGNTVTTGFEPSFLMVKESSVSGGYWYIVDNKRNTSNPRSVNLFPNAADADSSYGSFNFLSTGFQPANNWGDTNASGATYFYFAIA